MAAAYSELRGKSAIVTGVATSGGIGEAIALAFGGQGAHVAAVDLDAGGAERVAAAIRDAGGAATGVGADVTRREDAEAVAAAAIAAAGRIDVLVNNVGGFQKLRTLAEIDDDEWQRVVDLNMKSVFCCCRAIRGAMVEGGGGRIVNISSIAARARVADLPDPVHYSAAKGGVIAFGRCLAAELAEHRITVNTVAPGPTLTPRFLHVRGADAEQRIGPLFPLGRLSTPADVAAAVLFLASDEAANVTGVTLDVNGGVAMQ